MEPISDLQNLLGLNLGSTEVTDLRPINNLINLKWLSLKNTAVIDLKPLYGLSKLKILELSGFKVKQEEVNAFRKSRPEVDVEWP